MIDRFCATALLIALAGCGSSGGDDGNGEGAVIRIPALGVGTGAPGEDDPSDGITGSDPGEVPDGSPSEPGPVGSRDDPANELAPSTVATDGTPLPAEVDRRLRGVFDLANADAIEFAVAVARRLIDVEVGPRAGFAFVRSSVDEETGVETVTLSCPEGGTLDTFSASPLSSEGTYVLRACDVGPLVLDGRIGGRVRGPERETDGEPLPDEPSYEFDAFSVMDQRDGRLISTDVVSVDPFGGSTDIAGGEVAKRFGYGRVIVFDRRSPIGPGGVFERRDGRSFASFGTLETKTRTEATVAFPLGGLTTRFDVRFDDDEERVDVSTVAPFAGLDPDGRFARGSLTVTAEGYVYTLDADDGDPASFRLDVTEEAVTTSYTVPWSSALGFDAFEPERIDVGF